MPDFTKLIAAINLAEETAYGSDGDGDLAAERASAIDHYLGKNTEPAPDGRSQVVDRSVYETIQWIMPSLSRIFASGDDVVELPPIGPEDEEGAKQEAQYLNYIVLQRNNWFEIFGTGAKDALLTKAGYLYPYREKRRQVEIERYERQTPEGLALIMQDKPEVVKLKEYPDPDYSEPPPQTALDPATGQQVPAPPTPMLYDITIRRTKAETAFCIDVLPPERCKIAKTTKTVQLRECPYFEYYDYPTLSELRADGYEVDDDIASDPDAQPEEDTARDQYSENADYDADYTDPAMKRVKCRWIWIRHDYDEDGIAELQYVIRVGQKILHREEVNRIPIAVLCPDPLPHRHVGMSVADAVIDIQRQKTAILRQGLDNLYLSNNPRTYVNPSVINLDDLLVSRPGGVVRGRGVFGQDIAPIVVPFVFPQAMEGLEYMDQVRENRTGTNRYFTGIDQNALNKTATGIQQLSTMAAQRVEQIARHFSNGIEELFSILHEIILKSGHKPDVVKLRGQWVQIDPTTWRRRTDFRISVGYAAGNKDAMVNRLMLIAQMQEKAAMGGLPIVQPQNIYETAIELTKASDFATPERFWTDPATVPPPQPPQPDPTLMAIEELKAQTSEKVKAAELEQQERDSQRDAEIAKYKTDIDSQTKITITQMQREHDAAIESFRARSGADLETHKASLNPKLTEAKAKETKSKADADAMAQIMQSHQQHAEYMRTAMEHMMSAIERMSGPKRVVRGKDGRVEQVIPA